MNSKYNRTCRDNNPQNRQIKINQQYNGNHVKVLQKNEHLKKEGFVSCQIIDSKMTLAEIVL